MTKAAIIALCVCMLSTGCLRKNRIDQNSSVASSMPSAITGTIHGSPVDTNNAVLTNVSEAQLSAFLNRATGPSSKRSASANDTLIASQAPANGSTPLNQEAASQKAFALEQNDTPYMAECRKKGVPIPPPWGSSSWKPLGKIPFDRIFALDPRLKTEVFSYTAPNGLCAALSRREQDDSIFALGMICQGDNGNACFWDNVDVETQEKIKTPSLIRPELMSDATNLAENCSTCHRGDNVFIVHVGTSLEKLVKRDLTSAYIPVGPSGWENPAEDQSFAPKCQSCHTLPKLSFGYCSSVLMPSILGSRSGKPTMPPDGENREDYADDIQAIINACEQIYNSDEPIDAPPL